MKRSFCDRFHLKCKKSYCRVFHYFQIPSEMFDSSNSQCLLTQHQKNEFYFRCNICGTETSIDFDKVYNYRILKVVNDLYGE